MKEVKVIPLHDALCDVKNPSVNSRPYFYCQIVKYKL